MNHYENSTPDIFTIFWVSFVLMVFWWKFVSSCGYYILGRWLDISSGKMVGYKLQILIPNHQILKEGEALANEGCWVHGWDLKCFGVGRSSLPGKRVRCDITKTKMLIYWLTKVCLQWKASKITPLSNTLLFILARCYRQQTW